MPTIIDLREINKTGVLYQQTFQVINKNADFPCYYLRYVHFRINLLKFYKIYNNN